MKMLHIGLLGDCLSAGVEFLDPCLCDAVTVIQNSAVAGALGGLMQGRFEGSFTATDYTDVCNTARAIADQFIVQNTASGAAIADADNANVGAVVESAARAAVVGQGAVSTTTGDYVAVGKQIYASSKQAITKLI